MKHPFHHLVFAAAMLAPAVCPAVQVINNLAPGTQGFAASLSGPTAEVFPFSPFPSREVAFHFTTGADVVNLLELTFSINVGDPDLSPIQLTLSTGASVPGGIGTLVLGSVAPLSPTPIGQVLTLSPAGTVTLDAATNYWIHFTVPAGAAVYTLNNANTPSIAPGWALGNTWYYDPDFGGSWTEITSGPQARMSMNVQSVPEPATAVLGAFGMFFLLRRRR